MPVMRARWVVVNDKVCHPEKNRRKVCPILPQANLNPVEYLSRLEEHKGLLSYLSSFEELENNNSIA